MPEDIEKIKERIRPHLSKLEALRVECYDKYLKRKKMATYYGGPILAIIAFIEWFVISETIAVTPVIAVAVWAWVNHAQKPYKIRYKELVVPAVLKGMGDFRYDIKGSISMDTVKKSSIVPYHNRKSSEDYFTGKIDDIRFEFCELHLKVKGDKNSRTVFKGASILLTMPFKFQAHTVVGRDEGKLSNFLKDKFGEKKLVRLESPDFEKRYDVYSTDQQAARYVLSPAMMERLLELDTLFYKKLTVAKSASPRNMMRNYVRKIKADLECEFWDNKVLIMIPYSANLFEAPPIEQSAYELEDVAFIQEEIHMMTSIIEQLKLDYLTSRKQAYGKLGIDEN